MRPDDTAPAGAVLIPLRRRDGSIVAHAIVDAADAEWVNQWRWKLHRKGYASRHGVGAARKRMILLHRALLGLEHGDPREGDHIDRVKLNCRRSNLRILPRKKNQQNTPSKAGASSAFRGVYRQRRRWVAEITVDRKRTRLGSFETELEAAEVARQARRQLLPYSRD